MKALTLTQPWATLVAIGAKRIETRGWRTSYRGPLAIHAAKGFPADARDFVYSHTVRYALSPHFTGALPLDKQLPLASVIATCNLTACIPTRGDRVLPGHITITEQEFGFGNYGPGRWAWFLEDIVMLPDPIPAKGALSLWEWNRAVAA